MNPTTVPPVTDPELAELKEEAADPELSQDAIMLGGKPVKVMLLNLRAERKIVKLLAPYLGKLKDLEALDGAEGQVHLDVLGELIADLSDVLPECVAAAFERQDITIEHLDEHSNAEEILAAVKAQLAKNSLADVLGKLFKTAGRAEK